MSRRLADGDAARAHASLRIAAAALLVIVSGCASGPPPTGVERGDAAFARGAYDEADGFYAQALEVDARDAAALHGRARVALAKRDPEAALRFYTRLSKVDAASWRAAGGDYQAALVAAGDLRLRAGRTGPAIEALRIAHRIDPDGRETSRLLSRALVTHAGLLVMHGKREPALGLYREAIQVEPGALAAYVGAAEILIGVGKKQEALVFLETARAVEPADQRVRALTMEAMGLY